jgi:hypothetical protein
MNAIAQIMLCSTQWTKLPDVSDVEPISDNDRAVLEEIRAVLERYGALSRFGVNLIHRHFDLNPGEIILETTDPSERTQRSEVVKAEDILKSETVIETQWIFCAPESTVFCVGFCDYNKGHKHHHQAK